MELSYSELKERQQREVDNFPFGFAYNSEQFIDMMLKWGLDPDGDRDKIYRISSGGYIQKKDSDAMDEMFKRFHNELLELRKDPAEMERAFLYEMWNHEYIYNTDGDYDVLSQFGTIDWHGDESAELKKYFDELGFGDELRLAYFRALKKYWNEVDA